MACAIQYYSHTKNFKIFKLFSYCERLKWRQYPKTHFNLICL
nr:MAG TPA: hypothetical protein [Caudoviricetes sp.]